MKVLTLKEPWASLIAYGHKRIETRSWKVNYRGTILVHAGSGSATPSRISEVSKLVTIPRPMHGNIIAKVEIVDCVEITEEYANQVRQVDPVSYSCGDFTPGRYAWILRNPQIVNPIPIPGKLGLWNYNSDE